MKIERERLRNHLLLTLGIVTPIGVLAINASAFIMAHLAESRLVVAALAAVSSLILNTYTAWLILRAAERHYPRLYAEYEVPARIGSGLLVVITSAFATYFTYLGMKDPRQLPNRGSVITSLLLLGLPVGLTVFARINARRRLERMRRAEIARRLFEESKQYHDDTLAAPSPVPETGPPRGSTPEPGEIR